MIALVDYGAGNLTSVRKALAAIDAAVFTPDRPGALEAARAVIVPGVGHFAATRPLDEGWRAAMHAGLAAGRPLLGICVGLQWFFDGSAEEPGLPGLGLFPGVCTRLGTGTPPALKVPHVGWNSLTLPRASRLFDGVANDAQVYFTHSYAAPVVTDTVAICEYGVPFSAAVERGLVSAVQFHPEKSGDVGLRVLKNWVQGLTDQRTTAGAR
ncbi:MAG: imidazole glycerol phosphate synthase subunit HisH [Vicinamibacterales bacterium]|nr:imidazole glycerol phosphate synthase subunit HisH [Vicinamibacterales bacterium]